MFSLLALVPGDRGVKCKSKAQDNEVKGPMERGDRVVG